MTDRTISTLRRRLEKWELQHLRQHASDLAERLEPAQPIPPRPFVVTIRTGAKHEELIVLAASSCDAILTVMGLFFDDDDVVPPSLSMSAHPVATLTKAA